MFSMTRVDGRSGAAITDTVATKQKPKNRFIGAGMVTIHLEWFKSHEEAKRAVLKVRATQSGRRRLNV